MGIQFSRSVEPDRNSRNYGTIKSYLYKRAARNKDIENFKIK